MPSYIHPTINITEATTRGAGSSDTATLKTLFPGAPGSEQFAGGSGAAEYKRIALKMLADGEIDDNLQAGPVDRDFGAAATESRRRPMAYDRVPTGGEGKPASPWVPNPVSPGPGSASPTDMVEAPEGYGERPTTTLANVGASTDVTQPGRDPLISSTRMAAGQEVAPLVPGKSPATANAS